MNGSLEWLVSCMDFAYPPSEHYFLVFRRIANNGFRLLYRRLASLNIEAKTKKTEKGSLISWSMSALTQSVHSCSSVERHRKKLWVGVSLDRLWAMMRLVLIISTEALRLNWTLGLYLPWRRPLSESLFWTGAVSIFRMFGELIGTRFPSSLTIVEFEGI